MNFTAEHFIKTLDLQRHPEGGYYREIYRSNLEIPQTALPVSFSGARNCSTAIYYLLQKGDFSAFHKISSDELWHFYFGDTILIHVLDERGYTLHRLGLSSEKGEYPVVVVPAGSWFAAELASQTGFALMGCTVAPGFDFADFRMAEREQLVKEFSPSADIIGRLTRA
ncbi:MAG: cupin domain-containing protein [Ignavibacteria bacterium]|nr:cupin domain-containing protein [Ignavibacteria bacterium]